MKEIQIDANFALSVSFLKYKDKQLTNKERKRQQLVNEFIHGIVRYYLQKQGMTLE